MAQGESAGALSSNVVAVGKDQDFLTQQSPPDVNMWRSLGALLLVLGGLLVACRVLKSRYMGKVGIVGARRIRLIEKLAIDQRRNLLLVAVDDCELLLGLGSDHISTLLTIPPKTTGTDNAGINSIGTLKNVPNSGIQRI